MSFLDTIRKQINQVNKPRSFSFNSVTNAVAQTPKIIEKNHIPYALYGEHNLYPLQLSDLKHGSAIHNSILKTKAKMMSGDGLLFNGLSTKEESDAFYKTVSGTQKLELDHLLNNPHGNFPLDVLQDKLSEDYQDYGSYACKLIFNKDFTKIAGLKYYKSENIRAGKEENGKVTKYYYHKDWTKQGQSGFKPECIYAYNPKDRDHLEQMIYRKIGNGDYYGITNYSGAMNWIFTDFQLGVFHRSNLDNGMNPGLHFKFYKLPANDDEKDAILSMIDKQYKGAMMAGKRLVTFSDGKDLAMDIEPIEASNLDKQLIHLAELSDQKVLTGHQLTSPMLAGVVSKNGFGSNADELEMGYHIFDGLTVAADRKVLRNDIQWIFDYNKVGIPVDINKFKPFPSPQKQQPKPITQNG